MVAWYGTTRVLFASTYTTKQMKTMYYSLINNALRLYLRNQGVVEDRMYLELVTLKFHSHKPYEHVIGFLSVYSVETGNIQRDKMLLFYFGNSTYLALTNWQGT